jgi:hypothetical protein
MRLEARRRVGDTVVRGDKAFLSAKDFGCPLTK